MVLVGLLGDSFLFWSLEDGWLFSGQTCNSGGNLVEMTEQLIDFDDLAEQQQSMENPVGESASAVEGVESNGYLRTVNTQKQKINSY